MLSLLDSLRCYVHTISGRSFHMLLKDPTGFHLLGGAGGKLPPQTLNLPPPPPKKKLLTCQHKVPTKVGVVKDSKEFFPPKQKILDETLSYTSSCDILSTG